MKEGNPMNLDECRKAFEAWWNEPKERSRRVNLIQDRYDDALAAWQAAWSSRTESKPVTREVIEDLRIWWVDGQLLYDEVEEETYRDPDHTEEVAVVILKDLKKVLQLSAPQSPVVTLELQAPQSKVTRDELFTLLSAGVMAHKPELREQDGRYELDFSPTIGPLASDMMRFLEAKMMSAPQSPVVPGVGDWIDLVREGVEVGVSDAAIKATINQALSHIAHLLATSGRESHVDIGWVRSLLLNMKPSEIDDTAKLIFDTLAIGGRESREDDALKKELDDLQRKAFNEYVDMANRYRQALDRIYRMASQVAANPSDNDIETFFCIMTDIEALDTTSPKEPS